MVTVICAVQGWSPSSKASLTAVTVTTRSTPQSVAEAASNNTLAGLTLHCPLLAAKFKVTLLTGRLPKLAVNVVDWLSPTVSLSTICPGAPSKIWATSSLTILMLSVTVRPL